MTTHTISECLAALEVTSEDLEGCYSLKEEFSFIKKAYFKVSVWRREDQRENLPPTYILLSLYYVQRVLVCHPDKGGNAATFRTVHASFEALRDMFDNKRVEESFVTSLTDMDDSMWQEFADMPIQSYDYFYTAAEEEVPLYCVELAKSGRSSCKQKSTTYKMCDNATIGKGEVCCGSLDDFSGGYGRWHHLKCWRVPSKIWLGLPDLEECDDPDMFAKALLARYERGTALWFQCSPARGQGCLCRTCDGQGTLGKTCQSKAKAE